MTKFLNAKRWAKSLLKWWRRCNFPEIMVRYFSHTVYFSWLITVLKLVYQNSPVHANHIPDFWVTMVRTYCTLVTQNVPFCRNMHYNVWLFRYCKVEMDSYFSAYYVNMIGLLAKFVRASNSLKIVLRYFGQVWRTSYSKTVQY